MTELLTREISKEQFDRAIKEHNGYIAPVDKEEIFSMSELCGYGVYGARAAEQDGKYYVVYRLGLSCD